MKIRNWISLGLVVSTATFAIACGGKDKDKGDGDGDSGETEGDGGKGNYSTDYLQKEIDDLKKQIADLEEQIENASQEEIPDLQDDIDAANERLDDLETCANGGECTGVADGLALTAYSDAYCEWVFGCCSADEARATLGQGAKDEDGCKSMFSQLILRAGSVPTAPYMTTFNSDTFGQLAARLQAGRITLDADALEACIELENRVCNDVEPGAPGECAEGGGTSPCDQVMIGLQEEGESCASPDECVDGLYCNGGYGTVDGVCVVEAKLNDACQEDADCPTNEGHLYCNENTGACQERAGEGDDCEFTDPTFNNVNPDVPPSELNPEGGQVLTVPCLPGLWCSPDSFTCLATCDTLDEGALCNNSDQCGDDMYCDFSALDDQGFAGECKPQLVRGAASTNAEACESGAIYTDTAAAARCAGQGGETCSYDDYAGADCNSGSCTEGDKCRTKCEGQWDCGDDETCVGTVCYEEVDSGTECLVTEQCPAAEWCKAGNCEPRVKTGDRDDTADDCVADLGGTDGPSQACAAGSSCVASDCTPYAGAGSGKWCSDWYHCTSGRCDLVNTDSLEINKCKAASGLSKAGDDCDMEDAIASAGDFSLSSANINLDPCGAGLFCKRSKPYSSDDFGGTCTEQLEPGAICDQSLPGDVKQCAGNQICYENPASGVLSCRVPYSEPEQDDKCIFEDETFGIGLAYGDFPFREPVPTPL